MNRIQIRNAVPPSPNLEEFKQKNKSKSKRKNNLQATNPPTPKINQKQITSDSRQNQQNLMKNYQSVKYFQECQNRKNLLSADEEKFEKKQVIHLFKTKVIEIENKIKQKEEELHEALGLQQQKFQEQKLYILEEFELLKKEIDEKERKLVNDLNASQQISKQSHSGFQKILMDIKQSLLRYTMDIANNYEDILNELSWEQFEQIMSQYQIKTTYYCQNIEKIVFNDGANIYIPVIEIKKAIHKANVSVYEINLNESMKIAEKKIANSRNIMNRKELTENTYAYFQPKEHRNQKYKPNLTETMAMNQKRGSSKENLNIFNGYHHGY